MDSLVAFVVQLVKSIPGPSWIQEVVVKFGAAALLILPFLSVTAMFMIWGERKVAGRIQSRHGPMRVGGWHGWAQSLADGIKLILKEDLIPGAADHLLFRLAPYLAFVPAFGAFLCVAWSRDLSGLSSSLNVGVFFLLAILGIEVLGVILAGWASNNKWSVYGAMREACQMVSYEIPLGLSIICAVLVAGTLNMFDMSLLQGAGLHTWLVFHDPFNFVAFIVYYIAALASCKRAPFDLPESESELVSGYHTEYSGIRWSLFFFAEYGAMFLVSAIQVSLWLGAWYDPFGIILHLENISRDSTGAITNMNMAVLANILGVVVFITKGYLLMYLQIWIRWTLPRIRIDQVLYMCVKVLLPLACINLLGAALYLWVTDPLPMVKLIVKITLTVIGVLMLGSGLGAIIWFAMTKPANLSKRMIPNSRPLPTMPGL